MYDVIAQGAARSGDAGLAYLVILIAGACVAIAFAVSFLRWVLRINEIVAKQEEANEILGRICSHLDGGKSGLFDPPGK